MNHRPLSFLAPLALAACTASGTGTLQLNLTDAPSDLEGAATMPVTIDEVRVHIAVGDDDTDTDDTDATESATDTADTDDDGSVTDAPRRHSGWKTVCSSPGTFDLLTLTNGTTTPLCAQATLDAGRLTQIRLVVSAAEVTWDDGRPATTLEIPSEVVKIVGVNQVLPAGGHLDTLLDFDAALSVHEADGKLILRPTIKVVD